MQSIPHIIDDKIVVACAWCWPRNSWKERFPKIAALNLTVSHTICPACAAEMNELKERMRRQASNNVNALKFQAA